MIRSLHFMSIGLPIRHCHTVEPDIVLGAGCSSPTSWDTTTRTTEAIYHHQVLPTARGAMQATEHDVRRLKFAVVRVSLKLIAEVASLRGTEVSGEVDADAAEPARNWGGP
jgi:hypothetical protein